MFAARLIGADTAWAPSKAYNCGVLTIGDYCIHNVERQYAENWAYHKGTDELPVTSKLIFPDRPADDELWGEAYGLSESGQTVKLFSYRVGNITKPLISNNSTTYLAVFGVAVW